MNELKKGLEVVGQERGGTRDELATRLVDWLLKPQSVDKPIPTPAKKSAGSKKKKSGGKIKIDFENYIFMTLIVGIVMNFFLN